MNLQGLEALGDMCPSTWTTWRVLNTRYTSYLVAGTTMIAAADHSHRAEVEWMAAVAQAWPEILERLKS